MKEKRYEIIKRAEREERERISRGINAIGGADGISSAELLERREKHESPLARSSPVNEHGVQLQQGRRDACVRERQKTSPISKEKKR